MGSIRANHRGFLFFDFYFKGRCRERTGLKDSKRNRTALENKLRAIEGEIALGVFDYLKWFPEGNRAREFSKVEEGHGEVLVSDLIEEWFETHKKTVKPYTAQCYEDTIQGRLVPWGKRIRLKDLSRRAVKELVGEWLDEGLSVRSIRNYIKPLRQALEEAVEDGLVKENPARRVKLPDANPTEVNPLSFEEVKAFLGKVPTRYKSYFEVAFMTGLRPSEQIALKKRNVDIGRKKILVRESHVNGREGPPKTKSAVRDVDILPPILPVMKEQLKVKKESPYLFPSRSGGALDLRNLRNRIWYVTLKSADLAKRVPYQTRHTFASLMISSGEDINWVAKMMGDSVETVLRHYNRFIPRDEGRDGNKFLRLYDVAQRLPK